MKKILHCKNTNKECVIITKVHGKEFFCYNQTNDTFYIRYSLDAPFKIREEVDNLLHKKEDELFQYSLVYDEVLGISFDYMVQIQKQISDKIKVFKSDFKIILV